MYIKAREPARHSESIYFLSIYAIFQNPELRITELMTILNFYCC